MITDSSTLDLGWEKYRKGTMEKRNPAKVAAEAQVQGSQVEPWAKMKNFPEETDIQGKAMDSETLEKTCLENQLGMAKGTEKMERVKLQNHSFVEKVEEGGQAGWRVVQMTQVALEFDQKLVIVFGAVADVVEADPEAFALDQNL